MWFYISFSASLLQSSVSHDPSEIILICWELIPILLNTKNSTMNSIFVETVLFFSAFFDG